MSVDAVANAICDRIVDRLAQSPWSFTAANVRIAGPEEEGENIVTNAVPERCVFVIPTGGFPSQSMRNGTESIDRPTFQILVRAPLNSANGLLFADAVYQALHLDPVAGTFDCVALQPPTATPRDKQGRQRFAFNVALRIERKSNV